MTEAPLSLHTADRRAARTLILFGATGDLARRMLLPSLFGLHADKLIAPDVEIWGAARSVFGDREFRQLAADALAEHVPVDRRPRAVVEAFLERLHYRPVDVARPEDARTLSDALGPRMREPLALGGGPIAKLRDGDVIQLCAERGEISVMMDDAEWAARSAAAPPELNQGMGRELFALFRHGANGPEEGASAILAAMGA